MKSPFKFLDSFTKDDRDIFFGREREIEELYHRVFEGRIMLVYGVSSTGKSSLIHCGLANKFQDSDWLPINIRRGGDMVKSMAYAILQAAITPIESEIKTANHFKKSVRSLYLDHYKPIFFIFDQFEELFIFGNKEEKKEFVHIVKALIESDLQCRFLFVLREEYLAGVTEFEKVIPTFLANRVRIERMTIVNAIQPIEGPCKAFNIVVEEGFANEMLEKLSPESAEVELTYLQVFLDKIYHLATKESKGKTLSFQINLLNQVGNVSDLLGSFLDEQIELLPDPNSALAVLKSFVSVKGTKRQIGIEEVHNYAQTLGKPLGESTIKDLFQTLIQIRILRDKDQNDRYELRHDALATKIYEKITLVEKELLEIRHLIENAYSSWEKRSILISADDLSYIAPYENRLYLSNQLKGLIEKSKYALVKAKKRRRTIAFVAMISLLVVFAGFTWWAMKERDNAIKLRSIAIESKNRAEASEKETLKALERTELAKEEAIEANFIAAEANKQTKIALEKAELAKHEAIIAKEIAVKELYEAMSKTLSAEAEKINVLYRYVENPIRFSASGINENNFNFKIVEGDENTQIIPIEPFVYNILPAGGNSLVLSIWGITNKYDTINLGTKSFRIRDIPDPMASIENIKSHSVSKKQLLNQNTLVTIMPVGFDFNVSFTITSFTLRVIIDGEVKELISNSNKITDDQKNLISKIQIDDMIEIVDIIAVNDRYPDQKRSLNDLTYKIIPEKPNE